MLYTAVHKQQYSPEMLYAWEKYVLLQNPDHKHDHMNKGVSLLP